MLSSKFSCLAVMCGVFLLLGPRQALAQNSGIAGVVKDATGAVLPGVTVDASSPALIEKVRTATTDGQGQYKIVGLAPGTYQVLFSLTGFTSVRREGIELTTNFTASVNTELKLGAVEETITVTGDTPIVDVQNSMQRRVINIDLVDEIPTGRTEQMLATTIPGIVVGTVSAPVAQDVGGSTGDTRQTLRIHGSGASDFNEMINGVPMNALTAVSTGGMNMDTGAVQEFAYETGAISAERSLGGVLVNIIPKEGSNRFSGSYFTSYADHNLDIDNTDQRLIDRGLGATNSLDKNFDINGSYGGPLKRDTVWFYGSARYWGYDNFVAGQWLNTTQGSNPPVYTPDKSKQASDDSWLSSGSLRVTYQATPKHKFATFIIDQGRCLCHQGIGTTVAPESSRQARSKVDYLIQGTWTAPLTSRLLLEGAGQFYNFQQAYYGQPGVNASTLSVTEQNTGLRYNAPVAGYFRHNSWLWNWRGSATYVTGSHATKVGIQLQSGHRQRIEDKYGDMVVRVRGGIPNQVTVWATPYEYWMNLDRDMGIYAQDQWTVSRLTMNLGVRYDNLVGSNPEQDLPAVRFMGARDYAAVKDLPNWSDILPRLGFAFDLFGNGRTAVKASVGKYPQGETIQTAADANPINLAVNSVSRTWTDTNRNFYPDCDFLNPALNGECGLSANSNFGLTIPSGTYDPDLNIGWNKRPYNWAAEVSVEHQLARNFAVNAGYYRRSYYNFRATDNVLVEPGDYSLYSVTAPVDPNLPGGGGYVISGLYDISPAKASSNARHVTFAENFGPRTQVYDGVDATVNARLPRGVRFAGGVSTGRTETKNCSVIDSPQQSLHCHTTPPWQPQVRLNGSIPLPWGLQTAATFQSVAGPEVTASATYTNAQVAPSLGRNLAAGTAATVTVPLIAPGTVFGDRVYQLDARVTKFFNIAQTKLRANVDFYNALNNNAILLQNNTYGSVSTTASTTWRQPTYVLPGRLVKFSVQYDF